MNCSSNIEYWLKQAYKVSLTGRHKEARVGAILVKGGRCMGRESNMARAYGDMNRGFHAEERLLKRYRDEAKGSVLFVVRSNKNGKLCTMSRPCKFCLPLAKKMGIKKVIYFDWESNIITEKL